MHDAPAINDLTVDDRCTETERLWAFSVQLAAQTFGTPTEEAVLRLFDRVCFEHDAKRERMELGLGGAPVVLH